MENILTAKDVALYMIYRNKPTFQNNLPSSIKLQKLVFFAYLNHWAKYNKPLFSDKIKAYPNGCVVESVMDEYKNLFERNALDKSLDHFKENILPKINKDELDTLATTVEIYMDSSAKELSDLNHQMHCWKNKYKCLDNTVNVSYEDLKDDIDFARVIMEDHEETENSNKLVYNGVTYYYDKDFNMTDEIKNRLKKHSKSDYLDEDSYCVEYMEGRLVVY